ncbi:hypothetical protein ACFQZS_03280 [Mucilaginibacter calamicampi]|uniref:Uncharacterized protein n=1 Tax=Mucilaginibacter calamicampi TaxID=1302352 RepID=A0ABW2YUP8_9SPHI
MIISGFGECITFIKREAADEEAGDDQQIAETLDVLEGRFDIFEMGEHGLIF